LIWAKNATEKSEDIKQFAWADQKVSLVLTLLSRLFLYSLLLGFSPSCLFHSHLARLAVSIYLHFSRS